MIRSLTVLVLVGILVCSGLVSCAGSGEAGSGKVKNLKNENAKLRKKLEDAQQGNADAQESSPPTSAGASASVGAVSASSSASAAAGAPVPDKDCTVGKTCDLGPGSVLVRSIQPTKTLTSKFSSPTSGDFVVVEFDYTYQRNTGVTLDEPTWLLEDAGGNVYSYDFDLTVDYSDSDADIIYAELQPGVAQAGKVVYEVAPDAKDFTLYVSDLAEPQSGQVARIEAQGGNGAQESISRSADDTQTDQSQPQQAEEEARAAAEAYYQAVAARNWDYTYNHLDSQTQSAYTEQEWAAKNEYLANTGAVTYTIQSVVMDSSAPETLADVTVVLTATDGSTNVRNTYFVYEDGVWKHRFSSAEYDLLAGAPAGSASASATATPASSSASPSADIDCDQVQGPVPVPPGDPNNLDGDNDGLACE